MKRRVRTAEEKKLSRKSIGLRKKYGIGNEEYDRMFAKQDGLCAICGVSEAKVADKTGPKPLGVDHCHDTGRIRGLLCGRCNQGIGLLLDSPAIMRSAASYVESAIHDADAFVPKFKNSFGNR
jgi:hypothetical protein